MRVKFRRVVIWFKEGNMKDGVKTRKISRKTKFVSERRNLAVDGEGTEATMVKFAGWTGGFDVAT